MRTFSRGISPLFCLLLVGCGIHNFKATTDTPDVHIEHEADVGPFNSESSSTTENKTSDYERCLVKYEGMADSEQYCHDLMWADNPTYEACLDRNRGMADRDRVPLCEQLVQANSWYGTYGAYGYQMYFPYRTQILPMMP